MAPPHTQIFEDATAVKPLSSHQYSTNLHPDWTIGAVPHGGYTMSILYRVAITHFKHTHPTRHNSDPMPISMQMTFLRRTAVGPAILTVEDAKLGLRTSTIHVTLSQDNSKQSQKNSDKTGDEKEEKRKKKIAKVVGYITVSDPVSDVGVASPSAWSLHPPPPDNKLVPPGVVATADGGVTINSNKNYDNDDNKSGTWGITAPGQYAKFRKVENHTVTFALPQDHAGILDQWTRLRTTDLSQLSSRHHQASTLKGSIGKWTNEAAVFMSDWFPSALEALGDRLGRSLASSSSSEVTTTETETNQKTDPSKPVVIPPFWYPTVLLNIDFKKRLPPEGVDWLYSRVVMKAVRNGRMDIEAIVMDEQGDIVSLCSQVGLVVSVDRNTSGRKKKGRGSPDEDSKL